MFKNKGESEAAMSRAKHVVPPPKARRRPATIAAGVLLLSCGALGGWAMYTTAGSTRSAVAVRHDVPRGAQLKADDLFVTQINADSQLETVDGSQIDSMVGKRATQDLSQNGLLSSRAVGDDVMPPKGKTLVGVSLTPAQRPATGLRPGMRVRVVETAAPGGAAGAAGAAAPATSAPPSARPLAPSALGATVVTVGESGMNGQVTVDVLVPETDAPALADRAASGRVALVVDSEAR